MNFSNLQSNLRQRRTLIIASIAVALIAFELLASVPGLTAPMERLELSAHDTFFILRGPREPSPDIVIVAIDDASLNWVEEQWPWRRSRIAEIITWLDDAGARIIALDIFLFKPAIDAAEDAAMAAALADAKTAVSVNQVVEQSNGVITHFPPVQEYLPHLDGFGISEVSRDDDAVVRGIRAYNNRYLDQIYFNWSFEIARLAMGIEGPSNPQPTNITFNGQEIPLRNGVMLVNYTGPANSYPTYSAAFITTGDYDESEFDNKIVLIGATSETLQDTFPTPYSRAIQTPGVEIVANTVQTLTSGDYLRPAHPYTSIPFILGTALLAWILTALPRPSISVLFMAGLMLAYYLMQFLIFLQSGWQFALITPLTMLFLGVVVPTMDHAVTQELEKRRVRFLFSRFISPNMVDQLLETQDLDSLNKRAEISILFSDIRGFTSFSEKLSPGEVVTLLNAYLEAMTEVIHRNGGTVDKYEGDAIMAFFGEPIQHKDHALRAAQAALEMQAALGQLRQQWQASGVFEQEFKIGIGVHTGEVFVGLIGSNERLNYTAIGDSSNVAARLQELTKTHKVPIIISRSTYEQANDKLQVEFIEETTLRGRTNPVGIYTLTGLQPNSDSQAD
ncbi:MAG: adenylate/guanylate cyclase domain-containing protein [Chloroflexi bacterium]|nr:MAG: adenylate/guanylate cyclase domain-containing protein [Chloroflexota bacterium]MBL1196413.1 adenylate/guanylate cyclase domain-containing protein [Chloroflexota bacterium]NOH13708.1 adenylate/guanylate cyclase domain-containing protein [Chloroflexota bacterium]